MADEKRLIDANELVKFIKDNYCQYCNSYNGLLCGACSTDTFMCHVETAPTVDAVEVVHGRWEKAPHQYGFLRCSKCNDVYISDTWLCDGKWNYCPNCGADMRGEAE